MDLASTQCAQDNGRNIGWISKWWRNFDGVAVETGVIYRRVTPKYPGSSTKKTVDTLQSDSAGIGTDFQDIELKKKTKENQWNQIKSKEKKEYRKTQNRRKKNHPQTRKNIPNEAGEPELRKKRKNCKKIHRKITKHNAILDQNGSNFHIFDAKKKLTIGACDCDVNSWILNNDNWACEVNLQLNTGLGKR